MRILELEYKDNSVPGWVFDRVQFQETNLIVGNSGAGKSKLLNLIFNLCLIVTKNRLSSGIWDTTFEHHQSRYRWTLRISGNDEGDEDDEGDDKSRKGVVEEEQVFHWINNEWVQLIDRDGERFLFCGQAMPKLSRNESGIGLLKEEELIKPIYDALQKVMRRLFSLDALTKMYELQAIPTKLSTDLRRAPNLLRLFEADRHINVNLHLLSEHFKPEFSEIKRQFRQTFPFVEEIRTMPLNQLRPHLGVTKDVPVVQIRERQSHEWIDLSDLSSGMQKVLLILTDITLLPSEAIYIIDEYENSLGLNAIGFFTEFILTIEKKVQFFLTSHHPYLINQIPIRHWYVLHRQGKHVAIKYGPELTERYGRSKQQAFTQLINDPYFFEGVQ